MILYIQGYRSYICRVIDLIYAGLSILYMQGYRSYIDRVSDLIYAGLSILYRQGYRSYIDRVNDLIYTGLSDQVWYSRLDQYKIGATWNITDHVGID